MSLLNIPNRIKAVLRGEVALEDEDDSIRSVIRFYLYEGAVEILALPTKQARIAALAKIPALIRPHVEAEALRVWRLRQSRNGVE